LRLFTAVRRKLSVFKDAVEFAMKIRQRTEVNMVTSEVTVIRLQPQGANIICEECGDFAIHVSVPQAASILCASESETKQLLASGRLHSGEDDRGDMAICTVSLARCLDHFGESGK
jgi:hypothetical protein